MVNLSAFVSDPGIVEFIARGGGGGSGGGGSGGVGGLVMLGYVPAHFVTSWLNKHVSARAGFFGGTATAVVVTVLFGFFSIALGIIVAIGAAIGVYSGLHNWLARLLKKAKRSKVVVDRAALADPVWQQANLAAAVTNSFMDYQKDWSTFNLQHMQNYTSPKQFEHSRLLLTALYQMGRQNVVGSPQILNTTIIEASDAPDNNHDRFTIYIKAIADDMLINTTDNSLIYRDGGMFEEFWEFDRQGDSWVLDRIIQATENKMELDTAMQSFATQNGMFFSLDMGWLLLPQRGQLFSKAEFKTSDINNHIIGEWDGLLVQVYNFIPVKSYQRADRYVIGQITLPKNYGGIIIKRRMRPSWSNIGFQDLPIFRMAPRGYHWMSMEWPDFNKRYDVYATDVDMVTSFELLNPAFMAELYDMDLPVNIEVVDNVVYFYCLTSSVTDRYAEMLRILQRAHKELKR